MIAPGVRFRHPHGGHGIGDRRLLRMILISLVFHGVVTWFLLYHLNRFLPEHKPSAYLVELLVPAAATPEVVSSVPVAVPPLSPTEPVTPAPSSEAPPKPVQVAPPPPQQIQQAQPPSPTVMAVKPQPELAQPQSLQPKIARATPSSPVLVESTAPRPAAPRDVEVGAPTLAKAEFRRAESTALPAESPALPSARRNRDVAVAGVAPTYPTVRKTVQETLPEQRGADLPASKSQDVTAPVTPQRRFDPRGVRTDATLPASTGQMPLGKQVGNTAIAVPSGPSSALVKSGRVSRSESIPASAPGFTPPAGAGTSVPLPGPAAPTIAVRASNGNARDLMPKGQSPTLATSSSKVTVDQSYFRSLKTCVDPELELKLKTQLAGQLAGHVQGSSSCPSATAQFNFATANDAYSLQIGIDPGTGFAFKDRCDALQQAVDCVRQLRK